jgi:hypothetical protein
MVVLRRAEKRQTATAIRVFITTNTRKGITIVITVSSHVTTYNNVIVTS